MLLLQLLMLKMQGWVLQLVLVILSWVAFICNLMALVRWTKYHESRRWLRRRMRHGRPLQRGWPSKKPRPK